MKHKLIYSLVILLLIIGSSTIIIYHTASHKRPVVLQTKAAATYVSQPIPLETGQGVSGTQSNSAPTPAAAATTSPVTTNSHSNSCTTTTLVYTSMTEYDPNLSPGASYTSPGSDGSVTICPGRSPVTISPLNAIYHEGTMTPTTPAPTTTSSNPSESENQEVIGQCIQSVEAKFSASGASGESAESQAIADCQSE